MSRAVVASFLALALFVVPVAPSFAGGHGGGGHGGHGFHGHPGFVGHPGFHGHARFHGHPGFDGHPRFHGHFHGHGVIVVSTSFWWGPGWWGYPYYYPPYYYPPQVVVQPAPVIGEEQPPQSYWYYCPSARAYYPTAPTCSEAWVKVPPLAQ